MKTPSRILVTGGAGYIGSHCVTDLCNASHEVFVVDNLSEGHREAVDSRATFYELDISQTKRLSTIIKKHRIEAVIHFAACAIVGESMKRPGKYYHNNVTCGLSLLEAMRDANIKRIVFSSSCATYGIPDGAAHICETTPQNPINPYGDTKLIFERMLDWYRKSHGFQPIIFRYFNAAGAGFNLGEDHRFETHLIPNILKVALGQAEQVEVFGNDYPTPDGTAVRDYVHVLDIAEIHRLAVCSGVQGKLNLGTGNAASILEVIECCRKTTGHSIPLVFKDRREGDPPVLCASPELLQRNFNWKASYGLADCVQSAWKWHRENPNGFATTGA